MGFFERINHILESKEELIYLDCDLPPPNLYDKDVK